MRLDQLADAPLVGRLDDRPEQADGDGLDLQRPQPLERGDDAGLVQGAAHAAIGHDPLVDLEGQPPGDVGLGVGHGEVEDIAAPALAKDQDVRVALGDQERLCAPCCR